MLLIYKTILEERNVRCDAKRFVFLQTVLQDNDTLFDNITMHGEPSVPDTKSNLMQS